MESEIIKFEAGTYEAAVIGAGHAGCEAALALARMGHSTICFMVSTDTIAMMPCNPNIGGTSKGHLVKELDALGGEMGKNIDKTYIQSKMLNTSKGPAVHSLRAQADKQKYSGEMRRVMENTKNLTLKQAEVAEILWEYENGENDTLLNNEKLKNLKSESESGTDACEAEVREEQVTVAKSGSVSETDACETEVREEKITAVKGKSESGINKKHKKVVGVMTVSGAIYRVKTVVLASGVYLNARCIFGEVSQYTGPNGLPAATHLTESIMKMGLEVRRFKTGTPARIDKRTIDFSKFEVQPGDEKIVPFSFSNTREDIEREQIDCYLGYTNEETHRIIRENIDRSPLFSGNIKGTGPRYCPSIEDKVVKFSEKPRHQFFLEPEGEYTNEIYLSGLSSSLPEEVQIRVYRSIKGLEKAHIVRNAYAIEYDCLNATELKESLECKFVTGFFSAGQSNGSSGYEEAAAQGLIAGINAARLLEGKEPVIIDRSQGYIGVLIDDLVTKETNEPYRMMTSRAEYRLLLRQDNADLRLTDIGHEIGLIDEKRYEAFCKKREQIKAEIERLNSVNLGANKKVNDELERLGSNPIVTGTTLAELLRRPEIDYNMLSGLDADRTPLPEDVCEQAEIEIKYQGYIERQMQQVEHFKKLENRRIPADIDYDKVESLRIEARQKLSKIRPESVGQASRISGVSPADISVLLVWLKQYYSGMGSHETN